MQLNQKTQMPRMSVKASTLFYLQNETSTNVEVQLRDGWVCVGGIFAYLALHWSYHANVANMLWKSVSPPLKVQ